MAKTKGSGERFDLYQHITDTIIESLEAGVAPWSRAYTQRPGAGMGVMPINASSKRAYRGLNVLLLWMATMARGFTCDIWLTGKQVKQAGGTLKDGQGKEWTMITFWRTIYVDQNGKAIKESDARARIAKGERLDEIPCMRYYRVYNLDQTEGLDDLRESLIGPELNDGDLKPANPDDLDVLIEAMGVPVTHAPGCQPAYFPIGDKITMPPIIDYKSVDHYLGDKAHEAIHATGHRSRLDRNLLETHGNREDYAREELVAEMGAAFFCAHLGIQADLRHPDYIGNWLKVLRDDKKAIIQASTKAAKACEYLLNAATAEQSDQDQDTDGVVVAQGLAKAS